jgi:hypothetical protein
LFIRVQRLRMLGLADEDMAAKGADLADEYADRVAAYVKSSQDVLVNPGESMEDAVRRVKREIRIEAAPILKRLLE